MLLLRGYRFLQERVIRGVVIPRIVSAARLHEGREAALESLRFPAPSGDARRIWFHAASVGELEALWTVIIAAGAAGAELVITSFSESAGPHLKRLKVNLEERGAAVLFTGYSPWDGGWQRALKNVRPALFVTAKYEAWPELWCGLALESIPLVIVGARPRRSLTIARKASKLMTGKLPEVHLLTTQAHEQEALAREFRSADCRVVGDPRWDRIFERKSRPSTRVQALLSSFAESPRPWVVLGSVWREDLECWGPSLREWGGTLWIVPHDVSSESIARMKGQLEQLGLQLAVSSEIGADGPAPHGQAVLVNEMGFLAELYSVADRAYVGGGFSKGMHSVMEPAIYGVPVACGPQGAHRFQEIDDLQRSGQLSIVHSSAEIQAWLKRLASRKSADSDRARWLEEAEGRRGATARVSAVIEEVCRLGEA